MGRFSDSMVIDDGRGVGKGKAERQFVSGRWKSFAIPREHFQHGIVYPLVQRNSYFSGITLIIAIESEGGVGVLCLQHRDHGDFVRLVVCFFWFFRSGVFLCQKMIPPPHTSETSGTPAVFFLGGGRGVRGSFECTCVYVYSFNGLT